MLQNHLRCAIITVAHLFILCKRGCNMFNQYLDLAEYFSSVKLIVGSILIFVLLFAINVCIIAGISHIYKPLPSDKKKYVIVCSSITFALNIIFFILSLYDKASVVLVLILIAAFIYLEYWILAKFSENHSTLAKAVIIQTAINSAVYFIGSFYLSGFYILLFCMCGI